VLEERLINASGELNVGARVQFLFANHTLDTDRRELHHGALPVSVEPQVFDLLIYLVQNRNRVVTKDDLIESVWGGRIVSDSTLASRINAARRAIGDNGGEQKLIRTIARKGIRFVGTVDTRPRAGEGARKTGLASGSARSSTGLRAPRFERPAIAVLPFVNGSDEPEQDYFSDGISEDIITALARLRWFFVIARNSSFAYRARSVPLRQIGEELGVAYLLEGSVRKSGDRVRITAQLNDIATGNQVWAERYDRQLADVFAVQDEITEAIVAAIEPQVFAAENFRAQRKLPESLDAWDLVMRALSHFWRMTAEDNRAAQELLEQAVAIDPNYAQALAVLAVSRIFGAHMGWEQTATATPVASRAALAAVQADSDDPWAYLALAFVYPHLGRLEDALAAFESALRLNPSFSLAHGCHGLVLSWLGRAQEGADAARRALQLSPRDPFSAISIAVVAYAEFVAGNYAESMRLSRMAIHLRNDFVGGHRVLTAAAAMAGEADVARAALEELRRVQPNISLAWIATQLPFRGEQRERFLEAMRRAGLE
jgi:TolB-like protein/Tfp pilus assembly protein PilF